MNLKKLWKLRNKVLFKQGKQKVKVKHAIGIIIAVVLLIYAVPTQFATIPDRDNMNLSMSLDKLVLRKNLDGVPLGTTFDKGTEFSMDGTSQRIDPDGSTKGLPDLQISIKDLDVSDKDKTEKYTFTDGGTKYEVKATRHYVTLRITIEVEGKETFGDAYDETKSYYWEDMKLVIKLSGSGGYFGITDGTPYDVSDSGSSYGLVDLDSSWCKVEGDSVTIDNLSGDPSGLDTDMAFSIHINKAILYEGEQSYTAQMRVKIPLVAATVKDVTSSGNGNGDNGDNGAYTPSYPYPGEGISDLEMILALVIVGVLIIVVVMFVGGKRR